MRKQKKLNASKPNVLLGEKGTIRKIASTWIALGYPAPYNVAAASLGFLTVYREWNNCDSLSCERFFMPSKGAIAKPLLTAENHKEVSCAHAIGFSLSCETDLSPTIQLIEASGFAPFADQRNTNCPPIIIGGPLTSLDPHLVSPIADVVIHGDGEEALPVLQKTLVSTVGKQEFLEQLPLDSKGIWVPSRQKIPTQIAHSSLDLLPAKAATWSPNSAFKDLFLIEISRGCPRRCAFCVLSRKAECRGSFRTVCADIVLKNIPKDVLGVGLVGAAVTDHPEIEEIVERIVKNNCRVSLSSIRADKLTKNLVIQLKKGGLKSLTLAADGSSENLRRQIHKGIKADHLLDAAIIAKNEGIKSLKLYSMLGLPNEEDTDVEEFAGLVLDLAKIIKVSVSVQAFVPKPKTPLANAQMTDILIISKRLSLLKYLLGKKVKLLPTSPRWSWIDWKLAHCGKKASYIAKEANDNGGSFSAWKRAIQKYEA